MRQIDSATIDDVIEEDKCQIIPAENSMEITYNKRKLTLKCNLGEYPIRYTFLINKGALRIKRYVTRKGGPDLDQSLQVVADPEMTKIGQKGDLVWREKPPTKETGYSWHNIPFGTY